MSGFRKTLPTSCLCGYLSIRLMDNVMDEPQSQERHILPLAGFFHHEFQSAYLDYFPPGDDFWGFFRRTWLQSIEVTILDAGGESNDLVSFLEVAAKKTCAAKIPLFAVCRHSGLQSVPEPWLQIFDGLAAFHQMFNDLIDFQRDHDALSPTFFLSVAEKRREGNETVLGWVLREGFDWGYGELKGMIERLVRDAQACCSSDLSLYLELRKRDLDTLRQDMTGGIEAIRSILKAKP